MNNLRFYAGEVRNTALSFWTGHLEHAASEALENSNSTDDFSEIANKAGMGAVVAGVVAIALIYFLQSVIIYGSIAVIAVTTYDIYQMAKSTPKAANNWHGSKHVHFEELRSASTIRNNTEDSAESAAASEDNSLAPEASNRFKRNSQAFVEAVLKNTWLLGPVHRLFSGHVQEVRARRTQV